MFLLPSMLPHKKIEIDVYLLPSADILIWFKVPTLSLYENFYFLIALIYSRHISAALPLHSTYTLHDNLILAEMLYLVPSNAASLTLALSIKYFNYIALLLIYYSAQNTYLCHNLTFYLHDATHLTKGKSTLPFLEHQISWAFASLTVLCLLLTLLYFLCIILFTYSF